MGGDFGAIFRKKSMGYSTGKFSEIGPFLKNSHNSKIFSRNQLKLSKQHKDINMYQKM